MLLILILQNGAIESRMIDVNNYKHTKMPDTIVQCRAECINKFSLQMDNIVTLPNCFENNKCAMCWDFCEILFEKERHIFKSICTNHTCVSFI